MLEARLRRRPMHLARIGPLEGLHLVRRGGPQSGAVGPPQTGLTAPFCAHGGSVPVHRDPSHP